MMISELTSSQVVTRKKRIIWNGIRCTMIVSIRHDDECGNGHNTFSITAEIYKGGTCDDRTFQAGGCLHDEIREHFPEFSHLIKWHLTSTHGPLHYIPNTTYLAGSVEWNGEPKKPEIEAARRVAIWPDATPEQLTDEAALIERLPDLIARFKADIESIDLTF